MTAADPRDGLRAKCPRCGDNDPLATQVSVDSCRGFKYAVMTCRCGHGEVAAYYDDDRSLQDLSDKFYRLAHARPEAADAPPTGVLRIPEQPGLDPITCYFEDYAPGRGRITIACYGDAWTAAWGAMGNRTVREFVASVSSDYLACSLLELTPAATRRRKYAERIASAVIAALTPDQSP